MFWGKASGFLVGAFLSYMFVLPLDALHNLQLTALPISDLLRVFAALVIVVMAVGIGHFVDVL